MRRSLSPCALTIGLLGVLAACGNSGDDLDVVVLPGAELARSASPDAAPMGSLLAGGNGVQFISAPMYSSSCPPEAEASQEGATLTLTIDSEQSGDCNADAGPYTFLMGTDPEATPTRLVVEESGQADISLELAAP